MEKTKDTTSPRIVDAIRDADVIALQEVERFMPRTGMSDQPAEISAMLPDHFWVYGPETDLDASEIGEDGGIVSRRRQFGNMLLSRWPILSTRNHLLPYVGTTSHVNNQATLLEGVIESGGRALRICSLHLSHQSQRERLAAEVRTEPACRVPKCSSQARNSMSC